MVDLGSNSVRLVVFEGTGRNPVAIFNEKAVLRLGRGMLTTGVLNADAVQQALTVMNRYTAIARAMGAQPFEVLATAAVREATNGGDFVAALRARMPGVPIRILTGEEEADLAAGGVLCGIPTATGILADIGGGSLEVVGLKDGIRGAVRTMKLGVLRLAERAGGDLVRARGIAEAELAKVAWLADGAGQDLYVVGGAWRALARIHIAQTNYALNIVHHYTIGRDEARDLTGVIAGASRKTLERMQGAPRRRIDDLAYAAIVLRRLLRATSVRRVVFSANGLREGWYMQNAYDGTGSQDPLIAAGQDYASRFSRDPDLPLALLAWTDALFPNETGQDRRLREAACWMSDIGSRDHPEYRAEQAFLRILRQPGIGLDHHARAFLGFTLAQRYEAAPDTSFLAPARQLLSAEAIQRATILGVALRLAYTLSAGTTALLAGTKLQLGHQLTLRLAEGSGVFAGEAVTRRLDTLAAVIGLDANTTVGA
ncbi:MAG: Ppx/GppA family phosphatase [Acetobacteraceae bacterium]|nr:Ppx/GppA family phosphatase [Acetobacteraceae bacterium]